jgi:predicted ATP-dependent endonuclease of OLD family
MHLQRVQVPDFRVLKDVDITFEKDFNPRVFPLGSQNGGGKSTLLQLIFVLLHCSTNPERLLALKNFLNGFSLREGEDKRVLAIIDIWDGEKIVNLEFFISSNNYIKKKINKFTAGKEQIDFSFSEFTELENLKQKISRLPNEEKEVDSIIQKLQYVFKTKKVFTEFPSDLKARLLDLGIEIKEPTDNSLFLDDGAINKIFDDIKIQMFTQVITLPRKKEMLSKIIDLIIEYLRLSDIEYITVYSSSENEELENKAVLCQIKNLSIDSARLFLSKLSDKVFLAAPSTQIFLFLSNKSRKSLFDNNSIYQSELANINSILSGLFTYDFLAVDVLIESFKSARDIDFREALATGKYGNNYKDLLKDLEVLLQDKKVNLRSDFSGLTFTKNISGITVELEPEDLSHGELKRLSVYIWLKHNNIEDAIVLMDEVDLALHPDWQYQIVSDLLDWVPSNQYILATHSYELCNALTPSHVKVLEPKLIARSSD